MFSMGQREKLILKILSGANDNNISFNELCNLLQSFDFYLRVKGSLHIYYRMDIEEILNIQERNGKAKPYQVKQVRNIIIKYQLGGTLDV